MSVDKLTIGDTLEAGIWVTGEEPPEMRERYKEDVTEAMDYVCEKEGFTRGRVTWRELPPEDPNVPEVPDHIQGQRVRLLVGEARLTGLLVKTKPDSFIAELEPDDLKRLRKITRDTYYSKFNKLLVDVDCDQVIEALGPEAAVTALRAGARVH